MEYHRIILQTIIPYKSAYIAYGHLVLNCVWCGNDQQYEVSPSELYWHTCPAKNNDIVYFLNGICLGGATAYLDQEAFNRPNPPPPLALA